MRDYRQGRLEYRETLVKNLSLRLIATHQLKGPEQSFTKHRLADKGVHRALLGGVGVMAHSVYVQLYKGVYTACLVTNSMQRSKSQL